MAPQLKTRCLKTVMLPTPSAFNPTQAEETYSILPTASGHRFWDRLFQQALAALLHAVCARHRLVDECGWCCRFSPEPARLRLFKSLEQRKTQSLKRSTPRTFF